MILRAWTAHAPSPADASAYAEHLRRSVFPQLAGIDGHVGAYLAQRPSDGGFDVLVLTLWRSMDAIRAFAGNDPEVAVVEPEARRVLRRFDEHVTHYDIVLERDARA